jgi:hypothetical protein
MTTGNASTAVTAEEEEQTIIRALRSLRARFKERDVFASPNAVKDWLRLRARE